jgi:crotonobetainyl-CoA:carnitine CoA-transferase CaiB-like acyl-CoA transferase
MKKPMKPKAIDQAFNDPQVKHLGIVQEVADIPYLGQPVTLSRTPSRVVAHPPKQGEHTEAVLKELGFNDGEIADLRRKGIV